MSTSKRPTKARVTPGSVVGLTPDSLVSSPRRKVGGAKNKRSAPVETVTPRTTLRATAAAFTPHVTSKPFTTAAYPPLPPGASAAAKAALKPKKKTVLSTPSAVSSHATASRKGVTVDESKNVVNELLYASSDDDSLWDDVPSNEEDSGGDEDGYVGDAVDEEVHAEAADREHTVEDDDSDEEEDLAKRSDNADSQAKATAKSTGDASSSESAASDASDESDDEPPELYEDLMHFPDGIIGYYLDEKTKYWYATYDRLSVKQMKTLLRGRGQGTSGKKALLILVVCNSVTNVGLTCSKLTTDLTSSLPMSKGLLNGWHNGRIRGLVNLGPLAPPRARGKAMLLPRLLLPITDQLQMECRMM